jgi:hypothetical protein
MDESDDLTKELVLLQLKLDIESYYHDGMGPNLEWEKDRRKFIGDPYNVVVQGYCLECQLKTVIVFGLQYFLKELAKVGATSSGMDSKGEKPDRRDLPLPRVPNRSASVRYMVMYNQYCNIKYKPDGRVLIPVLYIPPQHLDAHGFSPEYVQEMIYDPLKTRGPALTDLIVKIDKE